MSKSIKRVEEAGRTLGLDIEIIRMGEGTRTAEDAANGCNCSVSQIVKSLIFEGEESGGLKLILVSGSNQVNLEKVANILGEGLKRSDPKRIRTETGFAIGGVSAIGHLSPIDTYMDQDLLKFDTVWVAAGAPDAVFNVQPQALKDAVGGVVIEVV